MGLTKVFVGNLSFKTNEADLASEFSSAGKVVSANIITRGPRSLGYGFVELESEEDALKAVQLMNKKVIDSREINVEIAKPREELKGNNAGNESGDANSPTGRGRRGGRGGGRGGRGGRGGFRGGRGRRNSRPRDGPAEGGNEGGQAQDAGRSSPSRGGPRRGRGRGRGGAGNSARPDNASRSPSQTTLFVANLPFSVDDAGLAALFKDHSAKTAHIVKNRNGRSKGFGFVEFENEGAQKAAFTATENLEVEGRKLLIKIALTENTPAGGAEGDKPQSPAPEEKKAATEEKKAETKA